MTVAAFSTSSPWASVAVLIDGRVAWQAIREAPHQASGACLTMLGAARSALDLDLSGVDAYAADVGPGSFTGVRVGVMLAKTFAYLYDKPVIGADSFDLIDPDGIAVVPSKRGEYFVRRPGTPPFRTADLGSDPFRGYGSGLDPITPPDAARFARLIDGLTPQRALDFVPAYLIDPSISIPKRPYAEAARG